MPGASRAIKRACQAASRVVSTGLTSMSYNPFTASVTPTGLVAVPLGTNAPNTVTVNASSQLREGNNPANTNGTYFTAGVFAEVMADGPYSVSVGNASISTSDRGIGGGYSSNDRATMVFFIMCGNTTTCRIYTWVGGTLTQVGTAASTFTTSGSDVLMIKYVISGADIIYTVYKNGTATACTWTDTGGATIGIPGRHPLASFRHTYSGSNFASPGIKSVSAALI